MDDIGSCILSGYIVWHPPPNINRDALIEMWLTSNKTNVTHPPPHPSKKKEEECVAIKTSLDIGINMTNKQLIYNVSLKSWENKNIKKKSFTYSFEYN